MAIATTQIVMKTGSGVPQASELAVGEIAIDIVNGELFTKDANQNVIRPNALLYLDQTDPQLSTALDANSNKIINLDTPINDSDAATKAYVDISMDWQRVSSSGFNCEKDTQYVVSILSDNPYVNLPKMTTAPEDVGAYVVLADAEGLWDQSAKHLTVNLNGNLQNQATGQLVLDIANVIVTFIWNGAAWSVYSTMAATQIQAPFGGESQWADTADGISYPGRIDTASVHTGEIEADYLLGTPRRHYEAVFGRAVPLDEELNSLEKRSVKHRADIERIDNKLQDIMLKEIEHPVVHEAIYDDNTYARRNGEWVPVTQGSGGESFQHKYVNTAETQNTTHDGVAAMQYEFYSDKQNTGLNVPEGVELNSIDLDFAYFHGKHPNTSALYNPKVSVTFKDDSNNELKTDILVHKQEFGWGQGFEKEFQQREVLVPQGATKVLVKSDNVHDDAPQDTSAVREGKTYYNRIGIEGYWY